VPPVAGAFTPSGRPYTRNTGGVRLSVRLSPKARRAGFAGVEADADGRSHIKVRVTAVPEGGKANRALIKLLASELKLPAACLAVATGARDRRKSIQISGDADEIETRLREWLREMQ
jgi:uncharacterized protein (TIGR00251 family)